MNGLYNHACVSTSTVGTGTIALGAAISGSLTFAQAGVPDGAVVTYAIVDGVDSEIGTGTYTLAGTTLTRDTVYRSTGAANTGKITLSGNARVSITPAAEDFKGTAGSIFFAGSDGFLAQDNANLFWDDTNKFLGIGTVPNRKLVVNSGAAPTSNQFAVTANGVVGISALAYSTDNNILMFDADYNSGFIARNATVAAIYKTIGYLFVQGSGGNTIGGTATLNNIISADLNNTRVGIAALDQLPAATLDVGKTAAAFRVRNLFTDASNGEWFGVSWSGDVATVGPGANGTGVVRAVTVAGAWTFPSNGLRAGTSTPASASATGTAGTITWDASFIYVCTATDTWERVAIATW